MINWQMLLIFLVVFLSVTILGFWAARWRAEDLNRLQEWGLAGRRFGTMISWFLLGGDVYTAYTFIAVPGLIFAGGALGFFSVPYTIIVYPLVLFILPRFWMVARHRGYITSADFVHERFDSRTLALLVALTGILATMPYIALQMFGIEIAFAQLGIPIEISLFIAFVIVAAYTYLSGLRAPALIAVVKDVLIWLVIIVAVIYIPVKLGGFAHIFAAVPRQKLLLSPKQYSAHITLALGSALALFLYPHTLTGVLSTNSRRVVRRNAVLLPAYTFLLGMIGLLGYVAIAVGVKPDVRCVGVWGLEVGPVEKIERFHAELQFGPLFPHRKRFVQPQVGLDEVRAANRVAPRSAERLAAVGRHRYRIVIEVACRFARIQNQRLSCQVRAVGQ